MKKSYIISAFFILMSPIVNGQLTDTEIRYLKGGRIGYSGNTGYSAFAHLHFQVQDTHGIDIATRFKTTKGIKYLRPGKWYKAI